MAAGVIANIRRHFSKRAMTDRTLAVYTELVREAT